MLGFLWLVSYLPCRILRHLDLRLEGEPKPRLRRLLKSTDHIDRMNHIDRMSLGNGATPRLALTGKGQGLRPTPNPLLDF